MQIINLIRYIINDYFTLDYIFKRRKMNIVFYCFKSIVI